MSKRSRDSHSYSETQESAPDSSTPSEDTLDNPVAKVAATNGTRTDVPPTMKCSLPPHENTLEFPDIAAFEVHYIQEHTYRCSSCGANLPSAHFLSLHIDENHNPLREESASRGEKTFACLLPDCERKCSTSQKRRLHVIDKHHFPKFYNFRIIDYGIDNATSLLQESRRRRVSITSHAPIGHSTKTSSLSMAKRHDSRAQGQDLRPGSPTSDHHADDAINGLETAFSALKFVPRSVIQRQSNGEGHDGNS